MSEISKLIKNGDVKIKLPKSLLIQTCNDLCLVLNYKKPDWFFCSKDFLPVLSLMNREVTYSNIKNNAKSFGLKNNEIEHFLDFLIKDGQLFDVENDESNHFFRDSQLKKIFLYITSDCNLRCSYCYRGEKKNTELKIEDIKKLITDVNSNIKKKIQVTITGGEPLLHKNLIEICEIIKSHGFFLDLNTNGTLLFNSPEIFDLVDCFNISIDGSTPEINDLLRGKGTFKEVKKAIDYLYSKNLQFILKPTITSKNIHDIPNIYKAYDCDILPNILLSLGKGKKLNKYLIDSEDMNNFSSTLPIRKQINKNQLPQKYLKKISCGMGVTSLSIDSNGNVYPCQLMHSENFFMGNISLSSFEHIYFNSSISNFCRQTNVDNSLMKCKQCELKYLCGGGCRARAFYDNDSIYNVDSMCDFQKYKALNSIWYEARQSFSSEVVFDTAINQNLSPLFSIDEICSSSAHFVGSSQ